MDTRPVVTTKRLPASQPPIETGLVRILPKTLFGIDRTDGGGGGGGLKRGKKDRFCGGGRRNFVKGAC